MSFAYHIRSHYACFRHSCVPYEGTLIIYHIQRLLFGELTASMAGPAIQRQRPQKPCGGSIGKLQGLNLKTQINSQSRTGRVAKNYSRHFVQIRMQRHLMKALNGANPKKVFFGRFSLLNWGAS